MTDIGATPQFASRQEELIHKLSARILGVQALFCPDNYGHSKEPADIVWVTNRCAILMNMTRGRGSFEKKVKHNISQLHRWLRKWRSGQPLTGISGAVRHEFSLDDVDYVIGLSVIDGDDLWCQYHFDQVKYSAQNKLAVCATVTDAVVDELANTGACARDVLYLLKELSFSNYRVDPKQSINAIRTRHVIEGMALRQQFGAVQKDYEFYKNSIWHIHMIANWMRSHPDAIGVPSSMVADLKAADIFWLGSAFAALESQMALPGETGPISALAKRQSGIYTLQAFVCAHLGIATQHMSKVRHSGPGIILSATLDFGRGSPFMMYSINPKTGPSLLEAETLALRKATLGY